MKQSLNFIFVIFVLTIVRSSSNRILRTPQQESLVMNVYYETLCPDSLQFLEKQVLPLLQNLTEKKEQGLDIGSLVQVELIPYGKAVTLVEASSKDGPVSPNSQDPYTFICQHGPLECEGNKLHSCALRTFSKSQFLGKEVVVNFLTCSMKYLMSPRPHIRLPLKSNNLTSFSTAALEICFEEVESSYIDKNLNPNQKLSVPLMKTEISQCIRSSEASYMLKHNGESTSKLNPQLYFVPWMTFNGIWSKELMESSLLDLRKVFCKLITGTRSEEEDDISKSAISPGNKILLMNVFECQASADTNPSSSEDDLFRALNSLRQMRRQRKSNRLFEGGIWSEDFLGHQALQNAIRDRRSGVMSKIGPEIRPKYRKTGGIRFRRGSLLADNNDLGYYSPLGWRIFGNRHNHNVSPRFWRRQ